MAAIAKSPIVKLRVVSLIAPSRYGPTNPPVLPTELISAIDAAAPMPAIVEAASAQNGPNIDASPAIAIDSVAIDHTVPLESVDSASPAALTTAATATCHRRSRVRSE